MTPEELIVALENASEPRHELFVSAYIACFGEIVDPECRRYNRFLMLLDIGGWEQAALTLVPKGNWWEIKQVFGPTSPLRHFGSAAGLFDARTSNNYGERGHRGSHDVPAIALVIACLRAQLRAETGRG